MTAGRRVQRARSESSRPVALTIAGSDSGGGAGVQADLKVFALKRVYGTSVVTGLTAQNTRGVQAVMPVTARMVEAQLRSVLDDLPVAAAKTGMLWSRAIIAAVAAVLRGRRLPLVVGPVMVASSGDRLIRDDAVAALAARLLPLATLVTPNLAEASVLTGDRVATLAGMRRAAEQLVDMGAGAALVKGGHLRGAACDVLYDGRQLIELRHPRVRSRHTHGTGCVLSSAIAAGLAAGQGLGVAVRAAVADVAGILARAAPLGSGHGPADPLLSGRFSRADRTSGRRADARLTGPNRTRTKT